VRHVLAALCLAVAAAGEPSAPEPDAAVAEAARWVGPQGCASGSHRSRALPIFSEIEEAWLLEFDAILAPPVHWDGTGYVVARSGGKVNLVAFDLVTGKELARTYVRDFVAASGLLVWDHMVLLQPDSEQITGYVLKGSKLEVTWICRGRQEGGAWIRPRLPVVHDNEVYCFLGDDLARFRPGANAPAWHRGTVNQEEPSLRGSQARPLVYGPFVFILAFVNNWQGVFPGEEGSRTLSDLVVEVHWRSNGQIALQHKIGAAVVTPGTGPGLRATITGGRLLVGSHWRFPMSGGGLATQVMLPLRIEPDDVRVAGDARLWSAEIPPSSHPHLGAILLSKPDTGAGGLQWQLYRDDRIYVLTSQEDQPDLFRDGVAPTVLGDVALFGSWAADLTTREILWRLPLARGVSYPPVPADRLVMIVDGGVLRAYRGRGKK
jgi:hypothetical protein